MIRKKILYVILYVHHKYFYLTCSMLLHYLVKFENPKMLQNFHVERDINMLLM